MKASAQAVALASRQYEFESCGCVQVDHSVPFVIAHLVQGRAQPDVLVAIIAGWSWGNRPGFSRRDRSALGDQSIEQRRSGRVRLVLRPLGPECYWLVGMGRI